MVKMAAIMAMLAINHVASSLSNAVQNVSSGSARSSAGSISGDAGVVESGYQIADVSGAQACGGAGFNYSRYWVGPMPDGNATKLNCISGYRCEAQNTSPLFWCRQYALALNAKCGGYLFYTLFKCIDGTACTIDPVRYEPRCLPVSS